MKTLDQICIEHGADKGSTHPVKGHDYARCYASAFDSRRNDPIKLLEIGVGGGESIRTWMEYFHNARIFGVDIVHSTNILNTPGPSPYNRYTFMTGDQSNEEFWKRVIEAYGPSWDIIIDDGGHSSQQIVTTFKMMWPHITPGGFYCIEDLNCAYSGLPFFLPDGWPNHMDFIKAMLDQVNHGENQIDRVIYSQELAIIQKKG